MKSVSVDVFLSASFDPADRELNEFFSAVCKGLDVKGTNVSFGASRLPPDQAMKMIGQSQGLIAICTKREELKDGSFNMPQAVNDEIAFACGKDLPVLVFMEDGVNKGGFQEKFNTYQRFNRTSIKDNSFLENAIKSIHEFKVELIGNHQIGSTFEPDDCHAEEVSHLIELKKDADDFVWEYSTTKKVKYVKDSKRSVPTSVFSAMQASVPDNALPIHWEYEHVSASGALRYIPRVEMQTASCVNVRLTPDPPAEEGDHISYRTFARHRYLTPVWEDETTEEHIVHLDSGDFQVAEGLLFIHRTKKAVIEFRFCREYGIPKKAIIPFVASYTSNIDFEVKSEIERAKVRIEDLGGSLTIRLEIDSALPGHLYGIAWNPIPRPIRKAAATELEKMLIEPKHDLSGTLKR
jgi:hypothetical protein